MNELKIFSGRSSQRLARNICLCLPIEEIGKMRYKRFSNCNIKVNIEESVRGDDVFVIQSGYPDTNEAFMELLIIIDALKYASASRITAVLPYYPYVRSDKKDEPRISITSRLVADLLETAGADRILTMDLHSPQIMGFSRIPIDQLQSKNILCRYISTSFPVDVVVSPDVGSAKRAKSFARELYNIPIVILNKRRDSDDEEVEVINIIGDVKDKNCLIVDDEINSGRTVIKAYQALKDAGGLDIYVTCTHGILSGMAYGDIQKSGIKRLIITNTINQYRYSKMAEDYHNERISIMNVSNLFAQAICAIHEGKSVSKLFL